MRLIRAHLRARIALPLLAAGAMLPVIAILSPDSRAGVAPSYTIDFHTIGAGGTARRNSCFGLSGTVGQSAPGYSSTISGTATYALYAGFWPAAPQTALDEIFFTGFEEC